MTTGRQTGPVAVKGGGVNYRANGGAAHKEKSVGQDYKPHKDPVVINAFKAANKKAQARVRECVEDLEPLADLMEYLAVVPEIYQDIADTLQIGSTYFLDVAEGTITPSQTRTRTPLKAFISLPAAELGIYDADEDAWGDDDDYVEDEAWN
jgi:hypothetical protein